MKKALRILMAVTLLLLMVMQVYAADPGVKIPDVTVQSEDTVYITIAFTGDVKGNAVGITYSYDETKLTVVPEECGWSQKGMLSDFSTTSNEAVWAASEVKSLTGEFCVLAFRIKAPDSFTGAQVQCDVIVKNGGTTVGTFGQTASVSKVCDHKYGDWAPGGPLGHTRVCEKCKEQQLQSHSLDNGVITQNPNDPETKIKVYTCSECGWTKTEEVFQEGQDNHPTYPVGTSPSEPDYEEEERERPQSTNPTWQTNPTVPTTDSHEHNDRPTQGNQNTTSGSNSNDKPGQVGSSYQPKDYNETVKTNPGTDHSTHDHTSDSDESYVNDPDNHDGNAHAQEGSTPMMIPVDEDAPSLEEFNAMLAENANAQKDQDESSSVNVIGIAAAVIILLAAGAGAWIFWKKRKS